MGNASNNGLRLGDLAAAAGVNRETIRYYERRGLVAEPPRSRNGYRVYDADAERRVRFIKQAQALGFTLEEVGDLLELRVSSTATCGDVRERAQRKVADVERRIAALKAMRKTLAAIAAQCSGTGPVGDCPILDALEGRNACRKSR
jgi:MerR family transcriptional regulator, copper efflux regulator